MKVPTVGRFISLLTSGAMFLSASAGGAASIVNGSADSVRMATGWAKRWYEGRPTPAYLGEHPGYSATRGGVWTEDQIQRTKELASVEKLHASIAAVQAGGGSHTLATDSAPGGAFPWEADAASNGGSVNSANGNHLETHKLFGWKQRGGMSVDFTLYHNSQTNYSDELGYGWTWTFDLYVNNLSTNPIMHWGDGLCIPYTAPGGGGSGGCLLADMKQIETLGLASVLGLKETSTVAPERATSPSRSAPREGVSELALSKTVGEMVASARYTVTNYTPPAGIYDALQKNTDGTWLLTTKDKTLYNFNTAGFCTSIVDRNGNTITFTLNSGNYVTKVTDATGLYYSIGVTSSKFTTVYAPDGNHWDFTINGSGDLSTVTWPTLGGTSYTDGFAYSSHRITSHTDRRGKVWAATYYSDGSLNTETDPLSHVNTWTYASGASTLTDPLSHAVTYNYSSGMLTSTVDQASYSSSISARDSNHNPTTMVDQRGHTSYATYDSSGNVLTSTDPLSHVTTYTYNSFGEPLTVQDALSHTTTNTYDSHGNLLTTTDPLSHVTVTNTFDSYGQLSTSKDALNNTTTFTYGSLGQLASIQDPLSHSTYITSYNYLLRPLSTTDPLSHVEAQAYDVWQRQTTTTHADSSTRSISYNATGLPTLVTDELSHSKSYAYDDAGHLTSFTNARGDVESYGLDSAGRRTTITNGRSKTSTYTFTTRGEIASITSPDSAYEQWTYDGDGNLASYINPLSQTISYSYDNANRWTGTSYPSGTGTTLSYDNANHLTSMVDSIGTTSWTYDNAGRITALNTPQGNMTYGYDNANHRTSMVEGVGTTTYSYDAASRITSLANPYSETSSYSYDNANHATQQTFSTGAYTTIGYDSRGRGTSVVHKNSSASTLSSESYVYDYVGNLTSKTVDGTTTTYGYDAIDQITSEARTGYSASYTYDANGNRASKTLGGATDTYSYDDGDKLTGVTSSSGNKTYGYDAAGRTTSIVTTAGTTTLTYDYEGRVIGITYPSSATNSFTYNGLDTRVGKVDSTGTYTYKRDGVNSSDPVLSDGAAAYTPGVGERRGGASKFYHSDRLGTNSVVTDSSQAVTDTKQTDAFGLLVASTGSTPTPFGFAGKVGYQEDGDSGLKLMGHRYFDASTGRFLSRDPLKMDRNWYVYCANNPLKLVDPSGLLGLLGWGIIVVIVAVVGYELYIHYGGGGNGGNGNGRNDGGSDGGKGNGGGDGKNHDRDNASSQHRIYNPDDPYDEKGQPPQFVSDPSRPDPRNSSPPNQDPGLPPAYTTPQPSPGLGAQPPMSTSGHYGPRGGVIGYPLGGPIGG